MRKQYRIITSPPLAVCLRPSSLGATNIQMGQAKIQMLLENMGIIKMSSHFLLQMRKILIYIDHTFQSDLDGR